MHKSITLPPHTMVVITTTEPTPTGDRAHTIALPVAHTSAAPETIIGRTIGLLAPVFPMLASVNARATAAAIVALGMGGV